MSVLEYAFKFMELSLFGPTYVADEKLKINLSKTALTLNVKKKISVCRYAP